MAATEQLTRVLAGEIGQTEVTVNAVAPTPIDTDLIKNVPAEKIQALIDRQSIKRFGKYEDVKNVIDFYLRPESDFITGQMVAAKMLFNEPLTSMEAKRRVVDFRKTRLARYKIPVKVVVMKEDEHSERFKKKRIIDLPSNTNTTER